MFRSTADFTIVQNDTYPQLSLVIYESDGTTPFDLSPATTTIKLKIKMPSQQFAYTRSMIKDGSPGGVYYQWQTGDLTEIGMYEAEIEVNVNGRYFTPVDRIKFNVVEEMT